MSKWAEVQSVELYCNMSGTPVPATEEEAEELPLTVLIPAFVTSELKKAFSLGFLLYIPFVLIDMVVASTLMSMGMVMLPPSMISTPFKLLLFVLLDGWQLLRSLSPVKKLLLRDLFRLIGSKCLLINLRQGGTHGKYAGGCVHRNFPGSYPDS